MTWNPKSNNIARLRAEYAARGEHFGPRIKYDRDRIREQLANGLTPKEISFLLGYPLLPIYRTRKLVEAQK